MCDEWSHPGLIKREKESPPESRYLEPHFYIKNIALGGNINSNFV